MEYADYAKHNAEPVDGFVLQGPVSDRDALVPLEMTQAELDEGLAVATEMIEAGRAEELMPRDKLPKCYWTPMTAYRLHSLAAPG